MFAKWRTVVRLNIIDRLFLNLLSSVQKVLDGVTELFLMKKTYGEVKLEVETFAIKVIGVGGSGGAAINRMTISRVKGVEFWRSIPMPRRSITLAQTRKSILESNDTRSWRGDGSGRWSRRQRKIKKEISESLKGLTWFITCGLGGGTGTAPRRWWQILPKSRALPVAVLTRPFSFEGEQRKQISESGYRELAEKVDTIITIPNDRLLQVIDIKKTSLLEAFAVVDDVLRQGVQGISDLITVRD